MPNSEDVEYRLKGHSASIQFNSNRRFNHTDDWSDLLGILLLIGIALGLVGLYLIHPRLPTVVIALIIAAIWGHHWYKNPADIWRNGWHWAGIILMGVLFGLAFFIPNWIIETIKFFVTT